MSAHVGRRVGSLTDAVHAMSVHAGRMPLLTRLLARLRRRRSKLDGLTAEDHTRIESKMRTAMEQLTERRDGLAP